MNIRRTGILTLLFMLSLLACKKDEDVNHKPLADFTYNNDLIKVNLSSSSSDIDNDLLTCKWIVNSDLVSITNSTSSSAYFVIPQLDNPTDITVTLVVSDGELADSVTKAIEIPKITEVRKYGLGEELESEISNNTDYEWYLDQMNTGSCSGVNCGPTSVTMCIKWFNKDFDKTPEEARNTYWMDGGWWYTNNITDYLNLFSVNNQTLRISGTQTLVNELDKGEILILCLDMFYIRYESDSVWHVDKFYSASSKGWGHFIVIKGYKEVDNEIYFEAYDPYSYGKKYSDNSIKGKDRYYRAEDIDEATNNWWDYVIIVSRNAFKSAEGVDMTRIENKPGR